VKDITGQKFGRLTAIRVVGRPKWRVYVWLCSCECGQVVEVRVSSLRRGASQSCGCLRNEVATKLHTKHGHAAGTLPNGRTPTYSAWRDMKSRCTNLNIAAYQWYGGAGIKVCDRWLDSFEAFLEDMGEKPEGTTLSRFADTGDYEPGNCAWHTWAEQKHEQLLSRARQGLETMTQAERQAKYRAQTKLEQEAA
jgi:hypothetical protein